MATELKYYGVFGAEGKPMAFYVDDIYPPAEDGTRNTAINENAIEISHEQWRALLDDPGTARYVDGQIVYVPQPVAAPASNPLLDELAALQARVAALEAKAMSQAGLGQSNS